MNRLSILFVIVTLALAACDSDVAQTPAAPDGGNPAPTVEPTPSSGATDPQATAAGATVADGVEVALELPPVQKIGTPVEVPPDTTVDHNAPPRKPLIAPPGTTNLARDKPVTGSEDFIIIGDYEQVTDGEKSTYDGYFIEMGSDTQWVQIDLEQPAKIYGVMVWHYHGQDRVYRDVIVQIANDPDFVDAVTLFNNDQDNTSGLGAGTDREYIESNEGHLIYADGQVGRYVRLYSRGNTVGSQNHYIEVEVFGVPAE